VPTAAGKNASNPLAGGRTEAIPTILTLLAVVILLAGAVLAQMNVNALHAPFFMSAPGILDVPVSNLRALAVAGGVVVLLWLAGMVDLMVLRARVRSRDALLHEKDVEVMRMKATAYDQEQSALADIRSKLDKLAQDINAVSARMADSPRSDRVMREEIRTTTPGRPVTERVAVAE
jgi:hypothetical protein